MRKWTPYSKRIYARQAELGRFEKEAGALPRPALLGDHGRDNGFGWSVSGFIEGATASAAMRAKALRPTLCRRPSTHRRARPAQCVAGAGAQAAFDLRARAAGGGRLEADVATGARFRRIWVGAPPNARPCVAIRHQQA